MLTEVEFLLIVLKEVAFPTLTSAKSLKSVIYTSTCTVLKFGYISRSLTEVHCHWHHWQPLWSAS